MIDINLQQLKEFQGGKIDRFQQGEFATWLDDIRNELEDPSKTLDELRILQGNAAAVRNSMNLIKVTIEENKAKDEHPELDNEDEE